MVLNVHDPFYKLDILYSVLFFIQCSISYKTSFSGTTQSREEVYLCEMCLVPTSGTRCMPEIQQRHNLSL